jgi:hypothetical protein
MDIQLIAEWITGFLAMGLGIGCYAMKSYRTLTLTAASGVFFLAIHFALRDALTAAAMAGLMSLRIALSLYVIELALKPRLGATLAALTLSLTAAWLTWRGWVSVPSTLATLIAAWAGFNLRDLRLRWALLLSEAFWLMNGLVTGSILATLGATLALIVNHQTLRRLAHQS